jgi:subtilisin family serine protease
MTLTWTLRDRTPDDLALDAAESPAAPSILDWSHGRGVSVCVVDSGVEAGHPRVGPVRGSWAVVTGDDGLPRVTEDEPRDVCGHGTACASIVRRVAPLCDLYSVRVLGDRGTGSGRALLTGLRFAVERGFRVVNLSLSTTRAEFLEPLRALADEAFFAGSTLVASAHNTPVESYPWRFSSVISVGSHAEDDLSLYLYNPAPPVEFFAPGQNVPAGWLGGTTIRITGNSFATPFISGLCARLIGSRPRLTPFQVKNALYLTAANVRPTSV